LAITLHHPGPEDDLVGRPALLLLLSFGFIVATTGASWAQSPNSPTPNEPPSILAAARVEASKATPQPEEPQPSEPAARGRTRLMLGVALKATLTPSEGTGSSIKPSFIWKWRGKKQRLDDRFALAYGLNSFSSEVSSSVGAHQLPIGDVRVRPLMLGVDYKMPRGKWTYSAGVQAGWSMNHVEATGQYQQLARRVAGIDDVWMDVRNSVVWAPKVNAWYDINRRMALQFDAAYFVVRPEAMRRINGVESSWRLNADAMVLKAGFVYGVF